MLEPLLGAYVLAGGRSTRFGSDKARAMIHGEPLLLRLMDQVKRVTGLEVTLVVNDLQRYADFAQASIVDLQPNLGPMGGLISAIQHEVHRGQNGWILILPCDLLDYDPAWHAGLLRQLQTSSATTKAIAFIDKGWLPFPAFYHTALLPPLQAAIQSEQLSLRKLLTSLGSSVRGIATTDHLPIRSINTREELAQYLESDGNSC